MAGEALDRRNVWEPSVYYALGKESFCFAGHEVNIRESIDTYGALIWPGVCPATMVCDCTFADSVVADVTMRICSAGGSFVPVLG